MTEAASARGGIQRWRRALRRAGAVQTLDFASAADGVDAAEAGFEPDAKVEAATEASEAMNVSEALSVSEALDVSETEAQEAAKNLQPDSKARQNSHATKAVAL
ncbi:hypothetical protein NX80_008455 [Xanthomonas vasicola pv. arecae]|uniref:hypothetical protein n=1 Tax=Xanthomonas vasicola TaxID=56459 RepID=UPI0001CBEFD5|nr:hypothetical protein [Xanthomonas vasicola]AZR26514.1 hypothetical protein NX80_008455 [Xanthomonas vasicola pv. arecae]MBV6747940.1 hypothetical protein [Xanthomonas vasicola pv. vasculorum NCPPB 890]